MAVTTNYVDLLIDPLTGDLDFSSGGLATVETNAVSLRQRLSMRFGIWKEEWYYDEDFGFPYQDYVGKKARKSILDNVIRENVRKEPDVLSIENWHSVMDRNSRSYAAYFDVHTVEGEVIPVAFVGGDSYYYPKPDDVLPSLCGADGWIKWKNRLHILVNFRLPIYGDITWYNHWAGQKEPNRAAGIITTEDNRRLTTEANQGIEVSKLGGITR